MEQANLDGRFTREEVEQYAREAGAESDEAVELLCRDWVGKPKKEIFDIGLRAIVREVVWADMVPGFHDFDDEESETERFVLWRIFREEVAEIAAELGGKNVQTAQVIAEYVKRQQVSKRRARMVGVYVVYALQCMSEERNDLFNQKRATIVIGRQEGA
jgi:hypothetical protein